VKDEDWEEGFEFGSAGSEIETDDYGVEDYTEFED
jgi:hypothetical protein